MQLTAAKSLQFCAEELAHQDLDEMLDYRVACLVYTAVLQITENRTITMARRCAVSGKSVMVGNNVSHANNKTKRTFRPNLQSVTLMSDTLGSKVRLRLTTHALRTIEHNGGLDSYLLSAGASKLTPETLKLKRQVSRAKAKKEASAA